MAYKTLPPDILFFLACKTAQTDDVAAPYHILIGLQDVAARYHILYSFQDCSHGCRPMMLPPDIILFLACETARIDDVAARYHILIGLQDVAARYLILFSLQDCSN